MLPCGQGGGGRGASLLGTDASLPTPQSPSCAPRALGADSLWLGSVWPQPDTQHSEPLGKSRYSAGKHTESTVSAERQWSWAPLRLRLSAPEPGRKDQGQPVLLAPSSNCPSSSFLRGCVGQAPYHLGGHHSRRGPCGNGNVHGALGWAGYT